MGMVYLFLEQYKRSHLSQVICIILIGILLDLPTNYSDPRAKLYLYYLFYTMYAVKVGNSSFICLGLVSDFCLGSFFIQNKNPKKIVWKISEKILKKKIRDKI